MKEAKTNIFTVFDVPSLIFIEQLLFFEENSDFRMSIVFSITMFRSGFRWCGGYSHAKVLSLRRYREYRVQDEVIQST